MDDDLYICSIFAFLKLLHQILLFSGVMNADTVIQRDTEFLAKKYLLMKLVEAGHSVDSEILKGGIIYSKYLEPKRLSITYSAEELEQFEKIGIIEQDAKCRNITAYKSGSERNEQWKQDEINRLWIEINPMLRKDMNDAAKMVDIYKTTVRNEFFKGIKESYGAIVDLPLFGYSRKADGHAVPIHTPYTNRTIIMWDPEEQFGITKNEYWKLSDDVTRELTYQHLIENLSPSCSERLVRNKAKATYDSLSKELAGIDFALGLDVFAEKTKYPLPASLEHEFKVFRNDMNELLNYLIMLEKVERELKSRGDGYKQDLEWQKKSHQQSILDRKSEIPEWFSFMLKKDNIDVEEYLRQFYKSCILDSGEWDRTALSAQTNILKVKLEKLFVENEKKSLPEHIEKYAREEAERISQVIKRDYVKDLFEKGYVKKTWTINNKTRRENVAISLGKNYIEGAAEFLKKNGISFMGSIETDLEELIKTIYPEFNTLEAPEGCSFNIPTGLCRTVLKASYGGKYSSQCDIGADKESAKIFFPMDDKGVFLQPKNGSTVRLPLDSFVAVLEIYRDLAKIARAEGENRGSKMALREENALSLESGKIEGNDVLFSELEQEKEYFIPTEEMEKFVGIYKDLIGAERLEKLKEEIMPPAEEE